MVEIVLIENRKQETTHNLVKRCAELLMQVHKEVKLKQSEFHNGVESLSVVLFIH